MRILVFFDLPTVTPEDRRSYRQFRKGLLKLGFFQLQESVYTRVTLNANVEAGIREHIRKIKPPAGSVIVLSCTEKQFSKAEILVGDYQTDVVDTDEKVVVL